MCVYIYIYIYIYLYTYIVSHDTGNHNNTTTTTTTAAAAATTTTTTTTYKHNTNDDIRAPAKAPLQSPSGLSSVETNAILHHINYTIYTYYLTCVYMRI